MKTMTAKLHLFDREYRPVIDPAAFLSKLRKLLGKPTISREPERNRTVYMFYHSFNRATVIVKRSLPSPRQTALLHRQPME